MADRPDTFASLINFKKSCNGERRIELLRKADVTSVAKLKSCAEKQIRAVILDPKLGDAVIRQLRGTQVRQNGWNISEECFVGKQLEDERDDADPKKQIITAPPQQTTR